MKTNILKQHIQIVEELIQMAKESSKTKRYIHEMIAREIIGFPYYWGDYSGIIEPSQSRKDKVVAHITNQRSGEETYWTFDSIIAFNRLKEIQEFSSWKEYNYAQKQLFSKITSRC